VLQTIPSLAPFGFLIPVPFIGGVGASTAIVALSLYALLPILRNTCIGIIEVDPAVVESARGMGMTPRQVLWQVQLPLAAPVLLAGIRVAMAMCIGVATIAAAIGAGGLGVFIFRGLAMVNNQVILAGAIPAAGIAIAVDSGLGYFQKSVDKR
jgi:osmoprotectant transport system permease protein